MYLLLTDHLACPRCGPAYGLILLAREVEDRRVLEGELGCSNCRDRFIVRRGMADLRPPPRSPWGPGDDLPDREPDPERIEGLKAALGVGDGTGTSLLLGDAVRFAPALARACPEIEFVAADPRTTGWPEASGVSRILAGAALPFFSSRIRGVALGPDVADDGGFAEPARVLAPGHRLVVLDPPAGTRERFGDVGLGSVVAGPGMLVAGR